MQTEYNTAVLRAHQAADWKQFEAEKDVLPNLEWQPSTSPNPGADHQPYWGTVLPIDHKFWNDHRPGDRWNCKCSLRNTDKTPTAAPTVETVSSPSQKKSPSLQPSKGLESNTGTTGEIFSDKHPYFPENCGVCPFNKGVGRLIAALVGKQKNCGKCVKVEAFVNEPKNGKQEKENYNKRVERKISGKELEVLKKTWNIKNESGKYLTPELINNSAASGFNFLGLEQLIISIVKSVNADVNINKLLTFTKKGVVRYSIKSSVVKLSRQFYYENDERIVEHLRITVTEEYREKGIAQKITAFLLGQYAKMNLDKLIFVAGKTHGGYYWAKKGFYAKNKKTALSAVRKHKSKCKRIIKQYYKKRKLKEDAPFPMYLIANKSWGKEALMGSVWGSEMILH